MKKATLVATLAISTLVLAGLTAPTQAATTTTDGLLEFKTVGIDDEGTVIKPGTEDEVIEPEGGGKTTGPLRITHVPDFDFGKIEIQTKNVLANAEFTKFKDVDPITGSPIGNDQEIAHFAQVEDIRGKKEGWELTVKSTKFLPAKPENKPLALSHIVLAESKLFNSSKQSDIANRVETMALPTAISTDDTTSRLVMKTKAGQHTETSKTSLVFNNAYTKDDLVGGVPAPTTPGDKRLNPGVQLKAFGTDEKAVDDTYTATVTWTLTAAL